MTEGSATPQQKAGWHPKFTCWMMSINDDVRAKPVDQILTVNSSGTYLNDFLSVS